MYAKLGQVNIKTSIELAENLTLLGLVCSENETISLAALAGQSWT